MAEKSIGKYWKPLSYADKAAGALFKEFTARELCRNLKKFSGQSSRSRVKSQARTRRWFVRTTIVDPGAENTEMNYRLQSTPTGPRIIDIYLKGHRERARAPALGLHVSPGARKGSRPP